MYVAGCSSRSVTSPALGSLDTIKWTGQDRRTQGHPRLCSQFEDILSYIRSGQK